ncbi:MAG: Tad domain-containing protein [Desulfobulbaceae bacterium]|nr:Tad domain-containing protein [Desulfobulbaceae bacterium]
MFNNEKGAVAILVTLAMVSLLGFAALAIDITHLTVVKNELQNAADAGALAGALVLFNNDDGSINTGAEAAAVSAAVMNQSDVELLEDDEVVATRGHWSFINKEFTANNSTDQVLLEHRSLLEGPDPLDLDTNFINAVQVVTNRNDIVSFFAKILGILGFSATADAVAYRGFAGQLDPGDVDQPIAVCEDSIVDSDDAFSCNIGRMINSGSNEITGETGGWTSYEQDPQTCQSGTNASDMQNLICGSGNPDPINFGEGVAANGGEINSAFNDFFNCWSANADTDSDGIPDQPWNINLLVVACPGNNMGNCPEVRGLVNINIIWINVNTDPQFNDVPTKMADWSCTPAENTAEARQDCWVDFVDHFDLQNVDESAAPYQQKAIYFLPDCSVQEPRGETGGENFGIQARWPKLVE